MTAIITTLTTKIQSHSLFHVGSNAVIAVAICLAALVFVHPLWARLGLHVPGELYNRIDFTVPVDSIFYVRNAQLGYRWSVDVPTSIWFHPFLSSVIQVFPGFVPYNLRFWFTSWLFAIVALGANYEVVKEISTDDVGPRILWLIPILPGGIGILTGNAEFPCLFFTAILTLSVIRGQSNFRPMLWASLAILTKPNALYMVPILGVYAIHAVRTWDPSLIKRSLIGVFTIILILLLWILYVDTRVGQLGAYWQVRQIASVPLSAGPITFLKRTADVLVYQPDIGERLKFLTALMIPIVDMWVLAVIPLKKEVHRFAILAGILTMLAVTFAVNNPNKIVVYTTTFPGHFAIGLLFLRWAFMDTNRMFRHQRVIRRTAGVFYLVFCVSILVFYLIGTPLEWYY